MRGNNIQRYSRKTGSQFFKKSISTVYSLKWHAILSLCVYIENNSLLKGLNNKSNLYKKKIRKKKLLVWYFYQKTCQRLCPDKELCLGLKFNPFIRSRDISITHSRQRDRQTDQLTDIQTYQLLNSTFLKSRSACFKFWIKYRPHSSKKNESNEITCHNKTETQPINNASIFTFSPFQ